MKKEMEHRSLTELIEVESAERIVACVNACAGIGTEALREGVVKELREALNDMVCVALMDGWSEATTGRQIVVKRAELVLDKLMKAEARS